MSVTVTMVVPLLLHVLLIASTVGGQQSEDGSNQQFGGNRCIDDEGRPQV